MTDRTRAARRSAQHRRAHETVRPGPRRNRAPEPQPQAMTKWVSMGLHWRSSSRCSCGELTSSTEASRTPGRRRTGGIPAPPRHFQSIAQAAAQGSLGPGDLRSKYQGDFPALAERDIAAYISKLREAVPLASGFAPIQFVREPIGFHRFRIYTNPESVVAGGIRRTFPPETTHDLQVDRS
jgi:hypothetical protein